MEKSLWMDVMLSSSGALATRQRKKEVTLNTVSQDPGDI